MRFERTQNRANRSRTELSRADFPFCHNQVTNPSTRDWGTGLAGVRHAVPVPVPQQNPGPYPGGLPYPCRSLLQCIKAMIHREILFQYSPTLSELEKEMAVDVEEGQDGTAETVSQADHFSWDQLIDSDDESDLEAVDVAED